MTPDEFWEIARMRRELAVRYASRGCQLAVGRLRFWYGLQWATL